MPPPSRPALEITHSPRDSVVSAQSPTDFSGLPKWGAMWSDQSILNPIFAGAKAAVLSGSKSAQRPSDPSRAQLAPPSARIVCCAVIFCGPSGLLKHAAPSAQPVQRQRFCKVTPCWSSRPIHARNSGDAFIPLGNTRPVEPVKISCPSPLAHAITSAGPKSAIAFCKADGMSPYAA